ncbi:hypothetical protein [Lentibacillus sp. Marseille-P4043]|uniref:hypothetical protein n=1 Tax=Lentibacillus sp. Marseille-P4043 TaxID=2040293 RepID=UPI00131A4E9D|nr:hypothetical protein [Lentibacillus sp. Marseille-P4043]
MNWVLPIGLTIGTFIGVYISGQSISTAIYGALGAFITGTVISIIIKRKKAIKE